MTRITFVISVTIYNIFAIEGCIKKIKYDFRNEDHGLSGETTKLSEPSTRLSPRYIYIYIWLNLKWRSRPRSVKFAMVQFDGEYKTSVNVISHIYTLSLSVSEMVKYQIGDLEM